MRRAKQLPEKFALHLQVRRELDEKELEICQCNISGHVAQLSAGSKDELRNEFDVGARSRPRQSSQIGNESDQIRSDWIFGSI